MLLVGAFLDAMGGTGEQGVPETDLQHPGYGGHDSLYFGGAAGVAWEPLRWARLQLLAEGGVHRMSVDSNFTEPAGVASLPFLGVKAGAAAFADLNPEVLGMRRVGAVLQVDLRTDLGSDTIRAGVPAGFTPAPALEVGGTSLLVSFGMAMEW
jgi:hypothetical protein